MSKRDKKSIKYKNLLSFLLVVLAITAVSVWVNIYNSETESTTSAVVEGKLLTVVSKIPGLVVSIYVGEGAEVKRGDLVAEIDRAFYINKLRSAELELRDTRMKQMEMEQNPENKKVKSPLSKFKFNHNGFFDGYSKMYGDDINQNKETSDEGDISCLSEPESKASDKCTTNGVKQKEIKKNPETKESETEEDLDSKIKRLEAEIEQGKLNLSYTKIFAPQDGIISVVRVDQGEYITSAQTIMAIIPKRVWVSANFTSEQADRMEVGQPVSVKISKYPLRTFKGMVDCIMPQEEKRNKKYVPVRILFIEDYSDFDIKPGTPAKVTVQVNKRLLR